MPDDRDQLIKSLQREVKTLKSQATFYTKKSNHRKKRTSRVAESPFRIPDLFDAMDADKSGAVDFDEFFRVCKSEDEADHI